VRIKKMGHLGGREWGGTATKENYSGLQKKTKNPSNMGNGRRKRDTKLKKGGKKPSLIEESQTGGKETLSRLVGEGRGKKGQNAHLEFGEKGGRGGSFLPQKRKSTGEQWS